MATAAEQRLEERDYFTDLAVLRDPYEYFEALRARGPVTRIGGGRDMLVVTGFQEAVEVLTNTKDFSALVAISPLEDLPFEVKGDDISGPIAAARANPTVDQLMVSYDGAQHAGLRSIMNQLFVPSRLKANEEFMYAFADQLVAEAVARGGCEIVNGIGTPFVTLVIADLLGVPADDRQKFREVIDSGPPPGNMNAADDPRQSHTLQFLGGYFARYIAERRARPREDVLTQLATATLPDGSVPDLMEIVKLAIFLFAAGQDTSAKLVGNATRFVLEIPGLQDELRRKPELIAPFLEETLRLEGSVKATTRLARRNTRIGDVDVSIGDKVVVALAAANRDPRRWPDPKKLEIGRPRIMEHVGFGRGPHVCVGAPLARVEVRVLFERLFEHSSNIRLDEEKHGGAGHQQMDYEPSYIIRGLEELHIKLDPR